MFGWLKGKGRENIGSSGQRLKIKPVPAYPSEAASVFYTGVHSSALLYRYGFVAYHNSVAGPELDRSPSVRGWKTNAWTDWVLALHPDTTMVTASAGDAKLAILGEVFNPFTKEFDAQVIADDLCRRASSTDQFLALLDELSGRFVVLVKAGLRSEWFVYNDAFSARSIYYNAQEPGVLASHAALLAELTADPVDFNVLAFTQSPAYQKRDVKYLPGVRTLYQNIFYCPANHRLRPSRSQPERYWPRAMPAEAIGCSDLLIQYLDGYADYIRARHDRELFGLTGGLDSRTLLAPLLAKKVPMTTFTLDRGDKNGGSSKDIVLASEMSAAAGIEHETLRIDYPGLKKAYFTEPMQVLRQNTGFVRLNSPYANCQLHNHFKDRFSGQSLSYSRGFGGELLRGFYQDKAGNIKDISPKSFSHAYDVLPGSGLVRDSFQHFIAASHYEDLQNIDPNDVFYWEHRMSGWGALAIAETDITACTYPGYNSRRLYQAFMVRPFVERTQRQAFKDAIAHFMPELLDYDIE